MPHVQNCTASSFDASTSDSLTTPSPHPSSFSSSSKLSIVSGSILVLGSVFFAVLAKIGAHLLDDVEQQEKIAFRSQGGTAVSRSTNGGTTAPSVSV